MKVIEILPKLPVFEVGKEKRRGEEDRAIEKGDKSPKKELIKSTRIRVEEYITCLSRKMRDNSVEMLIRSALISPIVVMIKFESGTLPGLTFT